MSRLEVTRHTVYQTQMLFWSLAVSQIHCVPSRCIASRPEKDKDVSVVGAGRPILFPNAKHTRAHTHTHVIIYPYSFVGIKPYQLPRIVGLHINIAISRPKVRHSCIYFFTMSYQIR
jgi:hypothetical protein